MKFLPLIWAGIWRRPARATLTMVSVVSAFVLFGVLQGFTSGLDRLVTTAHADVLIVQSQVSNIDPLPISMSADIARVPGVKVAARILFFGGQFRGPTDFLPAIVVDPDELRILDDQLRVTPAQWTALKATRSGALISSDLAKLYDLKVGDRIPLKPTFWTNREGTHAWPVDIVGVYPQDVDDNFFGRGVILNYDYIDQSRGTGAGTANVFDIRIADPRQSPQIAAAIDRLFVNSPHATRTFSQRQLALASVSQIGQVGMAVRMISGAVFFALLFSVGAVMIQSGRERTGEFAVLKTLGFTDRTVLVLILAEALAFCLAAAALGLAISMLLCPIVIKAVQFNLTPGPMMSLGLVVAVLLALATGAIPAWRASRLSIVDALAGGSGAMNPLAQIWTASILGLAALPQRLGSAAVTVIGVATAVAVMTSILAMGAGVRRFIDVTDQPDRAVVLSATSPSEYAGAFTPAQVAMIAAAPGIRLTPSGQPMVQPLCAAPVLLTRRSDGVPGYAFLRGTGRIGDSMNKRSLHLTAGRAYGVGLRELVVGRAVEEQYRGVEIGDKVLIHGAPWTVVGIYADQGGINENGIGGDVETVRAALESPTYQSVGVLLRSPGDFPRFRDALMTNPQLNVKVERLSDYYRGQMGQLLTLFDFVGYFVGGIMAVGAVCGALTTLFAAVDARSREIATLRAIGFGGSAIVASVVIEALALAIPGALIGLAITGLAFNGHTIATGGVLFKSTVTLSLALVGAAAAIAIGLVGGLFPAVRAASAPIAEALRAT